MKNKYSKLFVVLILFALLASLGFGCRCTPAAVAQKMKPVTLDYWTVYNDSTDYTDLISAYKTLHPNVNILVSKKNYEDYKNSFINALALDKGPDIISINNTWVREFQPYLSPLPANITLPYSALEGPSCKKDVVIKSNTAKSLTPPDVKANFVSTVYDDAVVDGKIYGLPLSMDVMVLYYNKKILNSSQVIEPPKTWTDFQDVIPKITKAIEDKDGKPIIQVSGVAMGTSNNIIRPEDILSVLMMQFGAKMSDGTTVTFARTVEADGKSYSPALNALNYYLQFAYPFSKAYSWNKDMPAAIDYFTQDQNLAFMFGYQYDLDQIKNKAPNLDLGIAEIPQVSVDGQKVNFANYWLEAVSNKSKNKDYAWDFLQFATSKKNVTRFLNKSNKPTALQSSDIINSQMDKNPDLKPFLNEILTAQSWYRGKNSRDYEQIFTGMIDQSMQALVNGETNDDIDKILKNNAYLMQFNY